MYRKESLVYPNLRVFMMTVTGDTAYPKPPYTGRELRDLFGHHGKVKEKSTPVPCFMLWRVVFSKPFIQPDRALKRADPEASFKPMSNLAFANPENFPRLCRAISGETPITTKAVFLVKTFLSSRIRHPAIFLTVHPSPCRSHCEWEHSHSNSLSR